jgi:hypothetical protein
MRGCVGVSAGEGEAVKVGVRVRVRPGYGCLDAEVSVKR